MHGCRKLLPLLTLVGALAAPAAAGASITEFTANLTAGSAPADITRGPDGNLWFTQQGGPGGIGRITPTGAITEYTAGVVPGFTAGQVPSHITTGPDGALWFTEEGTTGQIGRLDPASGTVTEYATGLTPNRQPTGITKGPDGNLWFTERGGAGAIGRITPGGLITEFTAGLTANSAPTDIVAGSDGNLWFTESANPGAIGRIDPDTGAITEFSDGLSVDSGPSRLAAASNGKLYFTQASDPGRIGRIKTDGTIEEYTTGLTANSRPGAIAQGGDGALWFTEGASPGRVGRLWPATEQITEFAGGVAVSLTADAGPAGITQGPDGNVWFTENGPVARIGRVTVPPLADINTPEGIGGGMVRLKARVSPNSQPTTASIEWGPTTAYGEESADLDAGAATGPVPVSTEVQLKPDAHYHARVTAVNGSGTAVSSDRSFYVTVDGAVVKEKPVKIPPATSTVVVEEVPQTPAPVTTTPPDSGLLPAGAPVLGESVGVRPVAGGSIRIKRPGAPRFVPLSADARIPVGSLIDARRGQVVLRSALVGRGRSQTGTFWGAIFQVRQHRLGRGMTRLVLRGGSFAACPTGRAVAGASALAREAGGRRRAVRRLWGKDHRGRFRTHGRDSVATVRGTQWVTTDRCDGTLTRVREGKVIVRDLHRKRNVVLTAGRAYLARHHRR